LRTKKKEQNVLKLFLLAFQETPTILYIKTTNEDGGGVFIDDQSRGLSKIINEKKNQNNNTVSLVCVCEEERF
jgi:hypothetical protein